MKKKIVIIGGGFFGMYIAEHFAKSGCDVHLVERETGFMRRASFNNQARVHNGYHYPRSVLTAVRSRISFPRFVAEFSECVDREFDKYYMIGMPLGKITAKHFLKFCERIGAPCDPAPERIHRLANPHFIEAAFSVVEYAFNADALRETMMRRVEAASVRVDLGVDVERVRREEDRLIVTVRRLDAGEVEEIEADQVFNCTYSNINRVLGKSDVALIPLKHELTEMCIVEVPDELKNAGITVMCGPFFSTMPFPPAGLHSFSHVRYTPHYEWHEQEATAAGEPMPVVPHPRATAWRHMVKDATRYLPILSGCRYDHSLWEVKTVLPRSEGDDSRPILFRPNHGMKGLHCVMGGKIDNVYDVVEAIKTHDILS